MTFQPDKHHRHSIRLAEYDYHGAGAYFVTVCTLHRGCLLGEAADGKIRLTRYGEIVGECWREIPAHFPNARLGQFTVMPNHIHGIIQLIEVPPKVAHEGEQPERFSQPVNRSVPTIMRTFKAAVTRRINGETDAFISNLWQRNYHEHVIRDDDEFNKICEYIIANPKRWAEDRENPHAL